jgi:hypothetical protein
MGFTVEAARLEDVSPIDEEVTVWVSLTPTQPG